MGEFIIHIPEDPSVGRSDGMRRKSPKELLARREQMWQSMTHFRSQLQPILEQLGIREDQIKEKDVLGVVIVTGMTETQHAALAAAVSEQHLGKGAEDHFFRSIPSELADVPTHSSGGF